MKKTIGQFTLYGLESLKNEFCKYASQTLSTDVLQNQAYEHATVIPYKEHYANGQLVYPRDGGVFDNTWKLVPDSTVEWGDIGNPSFGIALGNMQEIPSAPKFVDEDVVYLGHIDAHFGHFLVDSLQSLYIYLNEDIKPLKAVYISNGEDKFIDFFDFFGICRSNLLRIDTPTTFRSVRVCARSVGYHNFIHTNFKRTCDQIKSTISGKKIDKVYFSRSKLTTWGKVYGEELFEDIFKKNGFEIVYPETLSLREQIAFVKDCKILAGTSGSAMHLSVFMNEHAKRIHLQRSNHLLPMQILFDRLTPAESIYIEAFEETLPVNICYSPYFIRINTFVEHFFSDNYFIYDHKINYRKKDIINFIIAWIQAKRTLGGNYAIKNTSFHGILQLIRMLLR